MSEHPLPEIWAGLEGTVNRVGGRYIDQCVKNGHYGRHNDLDRFAELGIKALRYPVLWETTAPDGPETGRWAPLDARIHRLKRLGLRAIAGLVHHGSGPKHTNLLDARFPEGLARFARGVAERYPWIEDYTPVNEPLTTARFSAMYGHWYPHAKDWSAFMRALVVQCRAVVLAMRQVRAVNSRARLIQTEDMGLTFSTPRLKYQADFENERRWLSFDLLSGRIDREHPLYEMVRRAGIDEREIAFFQENPTPPDVVGLNYYLTSDRLLDEDLTRYPDCAHGGNDIEPYADVEAVRAWPPGIAGHRALLDLAWNRYHLPVAFTEVHLGCTREEQLRWLDEAWQAARGAHAAGVDVRAITVWSLLGAFDWNTLVTQENGFYEPGPYDVRGPEPRPTAIAHMTKALAAEGQYEHPVLAAPGWWRRSIRLWWGGADRSLAPPDVAPSGAPLLIIGASGTLGRAFAAVGAIRGLNYRLLSRSDMDIASPESVRAALERYEPWAVINAAGYVRVDEAEQDAERCFRENAIGPFTLAEACAAHGVRLVTFSSDLVFGGNRRTPYSESDLPGPLNVYGRSKVEAERRVLGILPNALVVRTGAFFGPWDQYNFLYFALSALASGKPFTAAMDATVSPTFVPDLANAALDLLIDNAFGIWHVVNNGAVTWAELARRAAGLAGLDADLVQGQSLAAMKLPAPRPLFSALTTERGQLLPLLDDALNRFVNDPAGQWKSCIPPR
jgi:dTDP-4-dehydrorhamnose reductase